jgi:hypothetical protein
MPLDDIRALRNLTTTCVKPGQGLYNTTITTIRDSMVSAGPRSCSTAQHPGAGLLLRAQGSTVLTCSSFTAHHLCPTTFLVAPAAV